MQSNMVRILREHICLNVTDLEDPTGKVTNQLREQHLRIWDAICKRQPDMARQAVIWTCAHKR